MKKVFVLITGILILWSSPIFSQVNKVKYVKKYEDPVLKELREKEKKQKAYEDSVTRAIRKVQEERKKKEREEKKVLRFDFIGVKKPASPKAFKSVFHFPPVAQYRTGTCWAFSSTSFVESEVYRITGQKIKLSEMFTVYHEYLDKVRRYVQERGDSEFGQGSECNAIFRIIRNYGAVPEDVYPGITYGDKHDHTRMFNELRALLSMINEKNMWDEDEVLGMARVILNKYMGEPPQEFEWHGKTYTPKSFVSEVLKINPDDYVDLMSTLSIPFYTKGEFKVPDNWWHCAEYYNVPLDDWYSGLKNAIKKGYSVAIGGDVSEPGYNGFEDAAIVPDFDIPQDYINQDSRELRIYNHTTTDDHGVHLVGYLRIGKHDWYLIKDSARSSRHGKFKGYYFYRDDYIKLKMLTYTVHKDAVKGILKKFKEK
ncbi:MAG: peptidase C1 [Candidatus Neomarinimicrobiota bacterium]|nr:peptidase C1 [Candidatus Neomarinimicrobiota bacterium]RKY49011.1 MAG: peptidase C1 [Candidatus Neomarinimicrobiota bacterium]